MGAPTEVYVDPSIAADSGSGTIGDPYGDLQYALNQVTRDATNGNRFNIKAGTDELLAATLSFTTYGTPTATAPVIFQGYTTTAGDGGMGGISCNGGAFSVASAVTHTYWRDITFHNSTAAFLFLTASAGVNHFEGCEFHTGVGLLMAQGSCRIFGCHFHDWTGLVALSNNSNATPMIVADCYLKNSGLSGLRNNRAGTVFERNIISGCSVWGILCTASTVVRGNSIMASAATGAGINVDSAITAEMVILDNIIEGFSGAGGRGIDIDGDVSIYGHNAVFNCTTAYDVAGDIFLNLGDNETLSATPFAKSGANTFANRDTYFAPVDTGNVHGGAYQ